MIGNGWLQIAIFGAIVVAITKPFGFYMTRVFVGEWTPLSPLLRPVERLVYRCCGVEESEEQSWRLYAISMVLFGATGFVTLYLWQRLQWYLPLNPQGQPGVEPCWRSIPGSASSPTPTGSPMCRKQRWATSCRWRG